MRSSSLRRRSTSPETTMTNTMIGSMGLCEDNRCASLSHESRSVLEVFFRFERPHVTGLREPDESCNYPPSAAEPISPRMIFMVPPILALIETTNEEGPNRRESGARAAPLRGFFRLRAVGRRRPVLRVDL